MNSHLTSDQLNPRYEECLRLHKCWAWFLVLGIILIVVGGLAIASDSLSKLTGYFTINVLAILLMVGGVIQVVNAFLGRSWSGFFLHIAVGILQFFVGELMLEHPILAADGMVLVLAIAFLVGGVMRLLYAAFRDFEGRGWMALNGFITLLLGISIWRQWPESSIWIIGLFVGIDLLFNGWSWVMLGLAVKNLGPAQAAGTANAPTSASAEVK